MAVENTKLLVAFNLPYSRVSNRVSERVDCVRDIGSL